MSQDYEGWELDARPAIKGMVLFIVLLLTIVIGAGLLYNHFFASQTRPDPKPFPGPELETIDSAPSDRDAVPASIPPAAINHAMAATVAKGDALWND
jgi:energy-converting hydrogenase Eha subunit F